MHVAVFGSWRKASTDYLLKGSLNEFNDACQEIGYQIVKNGHIVIGSSYNTDTADYHAIQGALHAAKELNLSRIVAELPRQHSVKANYPLFDEDIKQYPDNLAYCRLVFRNYRDAQLYAVQLARSIVIIGGGGGTYSAGLAAIMTGKRFVPVGSFGGAGERLLDTMDIFQANLSTISVNTARFGELRVPWSQKQLDSIISFLGLQDFPRVMIVHGRQLDYKPLVEYLETTLKIPPPTIMRDVFGGGRTLPTKLQELALRADGAIVVATPDDIGEAQFDISGLSIPQEQIKRDFRARQNIWLEVGMFWDAIGLDRILILQRGEIEIPSDLVGIEHYEYQHSPMEQKDPINKFIAHIRESS